MFISVLLPASLPLTSCYGFVCFFITDKKEADGAPHVVVMPTPSKRGRKKKATTLARVGPVGGPGHETLILAHLTAGGQVRTDSTSGPNLSSVQGQSAGCHHHRFFLRWFTLTGGSTASRSRPVRFVPRRRGPKGQHQDIQVQCVQPSSFSTRTLTLPPSRPPPAAECKRICFCASCWKQRRDVVLLNVSRALLDISIWHTQTSLHTLNCMLWHIRLLLLVVYEHLSVIHFRYKFLSWAETSISMYKIKKKILSMFKIPHYWLIVVWTYLNMNI